MAAVPSVAQAQAPAPLSLRRRFRPPLPPPQRYPGGPLWEDARRPAFPDRGRQRGDPPPPPPPLPYAAVAEASLAQAGADTARRLRIEPAAVPVPVPRSCTAGRGQAGPPAGGRAARSGPAAALTSRAAAVPVRRAGGGRAAGPEEDGVGRVQGEEAVSDDQGGAQPLASAPHPARRGRRPRRRRGGKGLAPPAALGSVRIPVPSPGSARAS